MDGEHKRASQQHLRRKAYALRNPWRWPYCPWKKKRKPHRPNYPTRNELVQTPGAERRKPQTKNGENPPATTANKAPHGIDVRATAQKTAPT